MSTIIVQPAKAKLPGTVNILVGTFEGMTQESVRIQFSTQVLPTILYPLKHVVQSDPAQVSHPVGQSTHAPKLESY